MKALYSTEKVKDLSKASIKKVEGTILVKDVINQKNKEVLVTAGSRLTKEVLGTIIDHDIADIEVTRSSGDDYAICKTLERDPYHSEEEAQIAIYRRSRPGDPPTPETAKE